MRKIHLAIAGVFLLPMMVYAAPYREPVPHLLDTLPEAQNSPQTNEKQDYVLDTDNTIFCSCVLTARYLGAPLPYGDAHSLIPNATPIVGGVVILRYGNTYHVAYITKLDDYIHIAEGNFIHCEYTERTIPFSDKHIVGFWYN